jgi:hypothetical protein
MRFLYIIAETLVLYVVLMGFSVLFVWGWRGFDDLGQLLLLLFAVVHLGAALKLVLIGNHRSIWTGFYRPVRILSLMLPGIAAFRQQSTLPGFGQRKTFRFDYDGEVASYDVVEALSARLRRQGIRHAKSGGLLVEDNDTTWWIEPEMGSSTLSGWVQSARRRSRDQIIGGIREFLERDMRLRVV